MTVISEAASIFEFPSREPKFYFIQGPPGMQFFQCCTGNKFLFKLRYWQVTYNRWNYSSNVQSERNPIAFNLYEF